MKIDGDRDLTKEFLTEWLIRFGTSRVDALEAVGLGVHSWIVFDSCVNDGHLYTTPDADMRCYAISPSGLALLNED